MLDAVRITMARDQRVQHGTAWTRPGALAQANAAHSAADALQRPKAGMKRWWAQLGAEPVPGETSASTDWQTCLDAHRLRVLLGHLRSLLKPGTVYFPGMPGSQPWLASPWTRAGELCQQS